MELGCLFPPTMQTPPHIERAEAHVHVLPMGPDIPRELTAFAHAAGI